MSARRVAITICLMLGAAVANQAQPLDPPKMVIEMRTGETHLAPPHASEGKLSRWFDLQTASIGNRYQFIQNPRGTTTANHEQYQVTLKGRFKFDARGKVSLHAGVFSGRSFFGGWNSSGWGASRAVSNLYLKELYLSVKPTRGVELQYGSLDFRHGEATEVTAYDYDGYVTGQRVSIARPDQLYFDEISYTAGYLGDFNTPNVHKRYHRLRQVNFHHVVVSKKINERVRASADYASESGADVFRQAVKLQISEAKIMDTLLFENYERAGKLKGYGFNIYGEKKLHHRLTLGGGFASIDRTGVNADRFVQGKRMYLNSLVTLTSEFSFMMGVTRAVSNLPSTSPRTRLDIGINYNLLHRLKRTGLF
jgi:hypothetical protein